MKPATMEQLQEAQEPEMNRYQVPVNALKEAAFERQTWELVVPNDVTPAHLELVDTWGERVLPLLRPKDHIFVSPEDQRWLVEFRVLDTGRGFVRLAKLREVKLPELHPRVLDNLPENHSVEFMGPVRLWCVLRGSDVIRQGFQSKTEAAAWANEATS